MNTATNITTTKRRLGKKIKYMPSKIELAYLAFKTNGDVSKVKAIANTINPKANLSYENVYYWYKINFNGIDKAAAWYQNKSRHNQIHDKSVINEATQALDCVSKIKSERLRKTAFKSISSRLYNTVTRIKL